MAIRKLEKQLNLIFSLIEKDAKATILKFHFKLIIIIHLI
jgi:hypothetical protein